MLYDIVRFALSVLGIEAEDTNLFAYTLILGGSLLLAMIALGVCLKKFPKPTFLATAGLMIVFGSYTVGTTLKLDMMFALGVIGVCAALGAFGGFVAMLLPGGQHHSTVWRRWANSLRAMRQANPGLGPVSVVDPVSDQTGYLPALAGTGR